MRYPVGRRTSVKKWERKGRRSFDTAIKYGTVAIIDTEKARTRRGELFALLAVLRCRRTNVPPGGKVMSYTRIHSLVVLGLTVVLLMLGAVVGF